MKKKWCIVLCLVCLCCVCGAVYFYQEFGKQGNTSVSRHSFRQNQKCDEEIVDIAMKYCDEQGYVLPDDVNVLLQDVCDNVLVQNVESGVVDSYEVLDDEAVIIKYANGLTGVYAPAVEGMANSGTPYNVLTIQPVGSDMGVMLNGAIQDIYNLKDTSPSASGQQIVNAFPDLYTYSDYNPIATNDHELIVRNDLYEDQVSVEALKNPGDFKVMIWQGHGNTNILWTSSSFSSWKTIQPYLQDFAEENLVYAIMHPINPFVDNERGQSNPTKEDIKFGSYLIGILPGFIDKYWKEIDINDSLIYLQTCQSMKDTALAQAFVNQGAAMVLGYTESVNVGFSIANRSWFFEGLTSNSENPLSIREAIEYVYEHHSLKDNSLINFGAELHGYPNDERIFNEWTLAGYKHSWQEATCTSPKTCEYCGLTEGSPKDHTWESATCSDSETCSECGEKRGQPLGHEWLDATCTEPQTCSRCHETSGEPVGHKWQDATYEKPKTCQVCGKTEGNKLVKSSPDGWYEFECIDSVKIDGDYMTVTYRDYAYSNGTKRTVVAKITSSTVCENDFGVVTAKKFASDNNIPNVGEYCEMHLLIKNGCLISVRACHAG